MNKLEAALLNDFGNALEQLIGDAESFRKPYIDEYQKWTDSTVNYKKEYELMYLALGLTGESGEVANKIKKVFRDNNGVMTVQVIEDIQQELGDVLWYMARLALEVGVSMTELAHMNRTKLEDRKARGVLKGNGDQR